MATSAPVQPHPVEYHAPEPVLAANELKPLKPASVTAIPAPAPYVAPAAAAPAKKAPIVPIAIAAIVVIAAVIGFLMMRKPSATVTPGKTPVVTKPSTTTSIASTTSAPAATGTVAPTSTSPVIDSSKVNEEVAKRMAAEKTRLEQLAKTQNQPPGTTTRPAAPVPQPQQQAATQTVAPQPVVENRPVPVPQPPAPAPQPVAESRPAPQPEAPRTQVGDLVPPGTPGLTAAHTTHQAPATYPPMARLQHVQGSVIISVLVSETGRVLETKIIRAGGMGLNEAADQSVRRSTFAPGVKDGVRVKSWTTVSVDFKL